MTSEPHHEDVFYRAATEHGATIHVLGDGHHRLVLSLWDETRYGIHSAILDRDEALKLAEGLTRIANTLAQE